MWKKKAEISKWFKVKCCKIRCCKKKKITQKSEINSEVVSSIHRADRIDEEIDDVFLSKPTKTEIIKKKMSVLKIRPSRITFRGKIPGFRDSWNSSSVQFGTEHGDSRIDGNIKTPENDNYPASYSIEYGVGRFPETGKDNSVKSSYSNSPGNNPFETTEAEIVPITTIEPDLEGL